MNQLPRDFEINKYGLHCRFVNEKDAEFIVKLRTDEKRGRFIHSTDSDVEKQVEWLREYKQCEAKGEEYYFIYEVNGQPFGVNRIYEIQDDHCTEGSWVCLPIEDSSKTIATSLIIRDIMFEILQFDYDIFDVRLGNTKVKKFHKISGASIVGQNDIDYFFRLDKEDYLNNRDWFIKTYNLI
jgi:hypothetical protein